VRQITLIRNGVKVDEFRLDLQDVIIGRGRSAHVRLDGNPMVSRQHAVVRERGEGHIVEDLGGANGTWVNGNKIDVHILRAGDHIVLGADTLRYDFAVRGARSLRDLSQPAAEQTAVTADELEPIQELGEEDIDGVTDLGSVRDARRQDAPAPPPLIAGGLHPGGERTAVASKDEIERLLAEMAQKRGPHVVLEGSRPELVIPLGDGPVLVGHTDACQLRLPGRRWFLGKIAAQLVKQAGGWCVVPESPYWNPVSLGGDELARLRQLNEGDVIVFKSAKFKFSRGEQR
jgi:pSer/pThr/pTyr-binding forkhead associated (FHA) protein